MPNHKPQRCTSGLMAVLKRADPGDLVLQSEVDTPCCRSQELLNSLQALLIQLPTRCCWQPTALLLCGAAAAAPSGSSPASRHCAVAHQQQQDRTDPPAVGSGQDPKGL